MVNIYFKSSLLVMMVHNIVVFAFTLNFVQNIKAEFYYHGFRIRTLENGNGDLYKFETILGFGMKQCVQTCKSKPRCKYINYRLRINGCFLIGLVKDEVSTFVEEQMEENTGYIFANMSEWNMGDDICGDCDRNDCPFPEKKEHAYFLGNKFTVGSKGMYTCNDGFAMNRTDVSRTTCNLHGSWSTASFNCLPSIVFTENVWKLHDIYFKLVRKAMTWNQSKEYCEEHGGYLADILSQEEQNIVIQLSSKERDTVWIGGSSYGTYGQFLWLDETPVNTGYSNWEKGQPYHPYDEMKCINMVNKWNYRWNDRSCNKLMASICKI